MRAIIPERYGRGILRALVVSNMQPDGAHPERGRFVRDQVSALRRLEDLEVELYEFPPGPAALLAAARDLRRRYGRRSGGARLDVVHAHFGLTAWPSLLAAADVHALTVHGTDLSHPRTRLLTKAALPLLDLTAGVSADLAGQLSPSALVLPCGVDTDRFHRLDRVQARSQLDLDTDSPFLLFPADPSRLEKRHDRAQALAAACGAQLRTLGGVAPEQVPLWVNAANAVVVPSEREGFGLAVLEALACDVPVLATPVGVHEQALAGVEGTLCADFDVERWSALAGTHLAEKDPRVQGRSAAERFSATAMAEAVRDAWSQALARTPHAGG
jgi:teichuronic acid biosynthesis glycosyltransferase TuaC